MNALDSMTAAMKPTGLYVLTGSTAVDFELQAYAAELDLIYDALVLLERESFAATAAGYGLTLRLRQFGLPSGGSVEAERAAVLELGAVTPDDFTGDGVVSALNAAGLACEITENAVAQKLYLNCSAELVSSASRNAAVKTAKLFLPAHLNAELDFRSISWNNIDQADNAYDALDALDLTWDAVDCYQNAVLQI
jgi:hypothetical protein